MSQIQTQLIRAQSSQAQYNSENSDQPVHSGCLLIFFAFVTSLSLFRWRAVEITLPVFHTFRGTWLRRFRLLASTNLIQNRFDYPPMLLYPGLHRQRRSQTFLIFSNIRSASRFFLLSYCLVTRRVFPHWSFVVLSYPPIII